MLNRLLAHLKREVRLSASRLWPHPGMALEHLTSLMGLLYGVLRWHIAERRTTS
jgi:hypothetical protein